MSARTTLRRNLAVVAGAAVVALGASACASDAAPADADSSTPSATADAAFPVTIESTLGTAVIEEAPERVVALGWGAADVVMSLGIVPVGIEADTWGGDEEGYEPWFREAVEAQGAELPVPINMYPELDVEAIAALDPDVVIAPQSGLDQATFDQLSALVPVVAHPGAAWGTSVEDQVAIAAKALGKGSAVQAVLDGMNEALSAARAEHPEFEGTTFAYVYGAGQAGTLDAYLEGDTRVTLLTDLGLVLHPSVADLTSPDGQFTATIGLENADQLADVDVLFTWFNDTEEQAATEAQPLWAQIPAVQSGAYLPMIDRQLGMAVSVASPLSIPWALDKYVPQIAEVVAKG